VVWWISRLLAHQRQQANSRCTSSGSPSRSSRSVHGYAFCGYIPISTNMPFLYQHCCCFLFFIVLKITNPLHKPLLHDWWTTEPFRILQSTISYYTGSFLDFHTRSLWSGSSCSLSGCTIPTDSRPLVILFWNYGCPSTRYDSEQPNRNTTSSHVEPPGVAVFAVGTLFVYFDRFETIRLTGGVTDPTIYLDQSKRVRDYNQTCRSNFSGTYRWNWRLD